MLHITVEYCPKTRTLKTVTGLKGVPDPIRCNALKHIADFIRYGDIPDEYKVPGVNITAKLVRLTDEELDELAFESDAMGRVKKQDETVNEMKLKMLHQEEALEQMKDEIKRQEAGLGTLKEKVDRLAT